MANYDDQKLALGNVFPEGAGDNTQDWARVEPLLTPSQLVNRFLWGIPLYSMAPDPVTGERYKITEEQLQDAIIRAVAKVEVDTNITLFPIQYVEKQPFSMEYWRNFGYIKVKRAPMTSLEKLAFVPSNGGDIFVVNQEWIEAANFHKGQINLIPILPAVGASAILSSSLTTQGSAFLTFLPGLSWIPALVEVHYTAGFPNGFIPRIINEAIGCQAAEDILSLIASTNWATSYSQGIDGISQSIATLGPQLFQARIDYLENKKQTIYRKVRSYYGQNFTSDYL